MTDQEITKIIAEKVMEWTAYNPNPKYKQSFFPLTNDFDCMRAWDKFSEKHHTWLHCGDGKAEAGYVTHSDRAGGDVVISNLNTDRRRAMCECMVKAVTTPNGKE